MREIGVGDLYLYLVSMVKGRNLYSMPHTTVYISRKPTYLYMTHKHVTRVGSVQIPVTPGSKISLTNDFLLILPMAFFGIDSTTLSSCGIL